MNAPGPTVLLIDDKLDELDRLAGRIGEELGAEKVRKWQPGRNEELPAVLEQKAGEGTVLVVTDYDLTPAVRGLTGHSVVAWCRRRFIPVGDFSRGHRKELPEEPDLFKLRVPHIEAEAVAYVVRVFEGFRRIREGIEQKPEHLRVGRSPAQLLAALLSRPQLESQLAPYFSKPGLFNSSLLDRLTSEERAQRGPTESEKTRLLTYILGHVLVNAVLKYPGPILAEGPLCAYMATSSTEIDKVAGMFGRARYTGPFGDGERLFWREDVDEAVEELAREFEVDDSKYASFGDYHRALIDKALGGTAAKHECRRCDGIKGGFWCPFTKRTVCERSDCSSTASSWVPTGAYACRIEKVLFDEWSPILGL